MYSYVENVQYLVAGLKSYNVDTVVVSPGTSHDAVVRSLEEDPYFTTYNIVDERSAAFFACGLIQEWKKPVALCCTSGTAASNYLSGVTEAFRRNLPLVVITGDKNQYYLAQYEDQMIDIPSIFKPVTRGQCILPIIENDKDRWYCQRVINEVLLELDHHGAGPVHIDIPIEEGMFAIGRSFGANELPVFHRISRYILSEKEALGTVFSKLSDKRVFIMCGQDDHIQTEQNELIEKIAHKYNCVFGTDKLSNLHGFGTVETTRAAKAMTTHPDELYPDIVICLSGNPCMEYKFQFKAAHPGTELWIVNEEGRVADPYQKLTTVFEGTTIQFLRAMAACGTETDNAYFAKWQTITDSVVIPELAYSNMYAVQKVMNLMPANSNFNIANSTTIRIAQYFDLDDSIQVYCNRGVNGIDGCVSTFIGQSAASMDRLNFLIVGDLTFFYDMNAIWNRYVGKNVRIMLNNNEGAALFHFNQGTKNFPTLNENVAAEHFATAKGWVESQGFLYLSAHNKAEFDEALPLFISKDSDKPIFLEVFTHKDEDARMQHEFYDAIVKQYEATGTKAAAKKLVKTILGDDLVRKLKGYR